jgi:hypothetical protein
MYRHASTCLKGPITRSREWWYEAPEEEVAPVGLLEGPPSAAPEPGPRHDLIARVRREIAEGTYDTPERWEAALERLLDRLEGK